MPSHAHVVPARLPDGMRVGASGITLFLYGDGEAVFVKAYKEPVGFPPEREAKELTLGGRPVEHVGTFGRAGEGTVIFGLEGLTVQIGYSGLSERELSLIVGSLSPASEEEVRGVRWELPLTLRADLYRSASAGGASVRATWLGGCNERPVAVSAYDGVRPR